MVEEGIELSAIHDNVVVKVPIGIPGLRAVVELREKNINTNVTLIFNPSQALLGPDRQVLAKDDDGGEGFNSRISNFELPENGVYTIIPSAIDST